MMQTSSLGTIFSSSACPGFLSRVERWSLASRYVWWSAGRSARRCALAGTLAVSVAFAGCTDGEDTPSAGNAADAAVETDPSAAESEAPVVGTPDSAGAVPEDPADRAVGEATTPPTDPLPEPVPLPAEGEAPRFDRPEHVRGIYLNAWTAGSSRRMESLVQLARRTEINSFVIDIKDASGYVSHRTGVPLARAIGADDEIRIGDLPGLLARLSGEEIYPIARIVIVKDPLLVAARPDMAVQDTAGGVWIDGKELVWLNPFDERVWDYHIALAREVAALGFPEIQWDYVRFPDAPKSELDRAAYPGRNGARRPDAIRAFLERSREELGAEGVAVTADVFGVTTSAHDVGIGQIWTEFIDVVDVALPMIYPSHYWRGSFGIEEPNAYPYEVVRAALEGALRKSATVEGAGDVRPWLQDFTLGPPRYGAAEVRAQIQATYDVGIREWLLWNPGSRYTEEALEPAAGWTNEPWIRVAGGVVPVSGRERALELVEAAALDSVPEIPATEVAPDTTGGG